MAACLLAAAGCGGEDVDAPPHSDDLHAEQQGARRRPRAGRHPRGARAAAARAAARPRRVARGLLRQAARLDARAPSAPRRRTCCCPRAGRRATGTTAATRSGGGTCSTRRSRRRVAKTGADPKRIAIGGFSMGGFGALALALQHPGLFCAAGGQAPALWKTAGATRARRLRQPRRLQAPRHPGRCEAGLAVRQHAHLARRRRARSVSAATTQLAHELGTRARFTVWPGTHTTGYVQRHLPQTLRWYAAALAACKSGRPGDA